MGYTIGRLSYRLLLVIEQVSDRGPQVLEYFHHKHAKNDQCKFLKAKAYTEDYIENVWILTIQKLMFACIIKTFATNVSIFFQKFPECTVDAEAEWRT